MPESLADVIPDPSPRTVVVGGVDRRVHALSMSDVAKLQRYVRGLPNPKPIAEVKARLDPLKADGTIDEATYRNLLNDAVMEAMNWPPDVIFDARAMNVFMFDEAAQAELVACALKVTPAQAKALLADMPFSAYTTISRIAFEEPEPTEGRADPKGPAAAGRGVPS